MPTAYGYIVRVATKDGDYWLGQRIYWTYDLALTVKHNLQESGRYQRVYIVPATAEHYTTALSFYGQR